ncbi:MAG TPA: 50S ribosomal protein L11 methyltransferase [Longimicrobiales bacterium]|nr:50S ribosomal protein L11 methyltransferase [Longimicrobiales bacterium]
MMPERWLEVRVRSETVPPDVLVEGLLDLGGRAAWEEDGWQVTHLPDPGDEGAARELARGITDHFAGRNPHDVEVATRWQVQEDWAELWKRGLDARRLTHRLVVTPSWIEPELRDGDLVIVLDPGMAFGNAEHGTTRGCLRILDTLVCRGNRILDVGAGSGILSIAAALMGADEVEALEMDPLAVPTARDNLVRNGVDGRVRFLQERVTSDGIAGRTPVDGVMANIETGLLRPLLPGLCGAVRAGGWLLLSGILDHEWDGLRRDVEAQGLEYDRLDGDGEWRSGLFRRPGPRD